MVSKAVEFLVWAIRHPTGTSASEQCEGWPPSSDYNPNKDPSTYLFVQLAQFPRFLTDDF